MLSLGYQSSSIWVDTYRNPTLAYSGNNHRQQYPFGSPLHYIRNGEIQIGDTGVWLQGIGSSEALLSKTANGHTAGNLLTLHSTYMGLAYVWSSDQYALTARCLAQ